MSTLSLLKTRPVGLEGLLMSMIRGVPPLFTACSYVSQSACSFEAVSHVRAADNEDTYLRLRDDPARWSRPKTVPYQRGEPAAHSSPTMVGEEAHRPRVHRRGRKEAVWIPVQRRPDQR